MMVFCMLVAVGIGLVVRRRRPDRRGVVGVPIATDVQPQFWVEINGVAEGLGIRSPDEVLLFADTDVSASAHRTWLGHRPGVRRLHLGLPLLAGLTEQQLRVVVAQAFSRSWGPVSHARVIRGGQEVIGWAAGRVGEGWRVGRIVGWYSRRYVAISSPVARRYELALDRLCADFAGNSATAAALREAAVLGKGWAAFVDGYVEPAAAVQRRPADLLAGFTCFLEEPGRRTQFAEPAVRTRLQRRAAKGGGLSLGDRLAAIESRPDDDMCDTSRPALGLMRNPDQLIRRVEEAMFHGSDAGTATWEDIMPQAARVVALKDAMQFARLGRDGGLGPALSVATLLELMSYGLADEMVRPILAEGASPEVERQTVTRLVTGFFATAAIQSGTASYRFSWAAPKQLVDDQGAISDLPMLVESALADENKVSAIEKWLEAHNVSLELELGEDLGKAAMEDLTAALAGSHDDGRADDPSADPVDDSRALRVSESGSALAWSPSVWTPPDP